ncbi:acyltransferase [Desulfosarcina sp. OttesenSCG-928-G10]|nr:acyltransferase [Desulfosarcina sp. OttesenSCG-928-G10]MDL2321193.1 acyltransferase [Desulfosarcina sp. OttesenSCG-928-B08]
MGKRFVQYCFLFFAALPYLWWNVTSLFLGAERAFQGSSQFCALFPGTIGSLFRAAFYRLSLPESSQSTVIGFLSTFSHPEARLEKHVSCGACCNIGWTHIGEHCIIGSHVCITSGKKQHAFNASDKPIRLQGGEKTRVMIGRDCWIGASAVIMADIGEGSVIAAGSVVIDPIPPYSVAAGNPAKVIKSRL